MKAKRLGLLLSVLACALLAATFAHPTLSLKRMTYRYVLVFDITQSMNVVDQPVVHPTTSRLEFAKQSAVEALTRLPCGSEVGIALFTGHRALLLIMPVEICANYREVSTIISGIDWRMAWEAKSEIAKGLYKSIGLMQQLGGSTRLMFFTDGQEAPVINPEVVPQFTGKAGEIAGMIVGIGGDKPLSIPKFDAHGQVKGYWQPADIAAAYSDTNDNLAIGGEHLSALHESYLKELAVKTGLLYARLEDAAALGDQLTTSALGIPKVQTTDMRWLCALAALLIYLATYLVGRQTK